MPLPEGWIKVLRVNSGIVYKDTYNNNESEEHPYILEALNAARKLELETGWTVKEAMLEDDSFGFSYFNAELGLSLRYPPYLRQCLADVLGSHGHSTVALWILSENERKPSTSSPILPSSQTPSVDGVMLVSPNGPIYTGGGIGNFLSKI